MKEEYINRLYYLAKLKNYKGTRDEFVEKLQTDDSYFNYALYMARNDKVKYKGTDEEFSIAIGRTKPQSTQSETVATEEKPVVEEPIVEEPIAKEEVKLEEPVVEEPIVEEKPAIQVKEVEAPKEEVVKREMPIGENLVPITEKTEVKSVETPSDKMVIKSEKKEEVKEQPKTEDKPQMEVKDVTKEESKMVIKSENKENTNQQPQTFSKPIIINGVKFDDDMNLMRTFKPSYFEEYKELSKLAKPVDKSLDEIAQSFTKNLEGIQLDRNISLSFPDPPNVNKKSAVTQNTENIFEDKIGNKNVYTYYDDKNKKWYVYNKEKNNNNWNEVTSPQIKTVLNAKYKNNSGEIDKSKIFKINEAEADKIIKIKEYYYYNKYLPTLIENWDNLKENQKESIKKDLNVLLMKRLSRDMYHKEKYKEEIKDIEERIKRNENVDEIDMNLLKYGNPDERYDKFWEYVVEKTGAGDYEVKTLIKKYKEQLKTH
jgi:hypothetical protein